MKLSHVIAIVLSLLAVRVSGAEPATLRVLLYPIVPDARDLFFRLEAEFEGKNPGVDLQLVEINDYYRRGLLDADADVYEIDTVLLADMVASGKIDPLTLPSLKFLSNAREAVTLNGKTWGVPHWVCGNYLFYDANDAALRNVASFAELAEVLSAGEFAADFKGTSTLGEWYVTMVAAENGDRRELLAHLAKDEENPGVATRLRALLKDCPPAFCRSEDLHNRAGFYARAFIRREIRAYIGYSESIHYALQELRNDCTSASRCRDEKAIAVQPLPLVAPQGKRVGWTDALAVRAGLSKARRQLAEEFIHFAVSPDTYRMLLRSEWPDAPFYLLPAVEVEGLEEIGPLYPAFLSQFGDRLILSGPGLNDAARARGRRINCALPPDRDDDKWFADCAATTKR